MQLLRQEVKNPVGVFSDIRPSDLPVDVWSDAKNVSFKDGKAVRAGGYRSALPPFPDRPVGQEPLFAIPYLVEAVPYWLVASSGLIGKTEGSTFQDVTRPSSMYSASRDFPWNGGFLSGLVVLNNGFDVPQVLSPVESTFKDLPNWPSDTRAKVVRPFKSFLIAMNLTRDSRDMPTVVKWSSPADPGESPISWDATDPTKDSGENSLSDTAGAIVDGKKLRDSFIIYKEDSVYSMRFVGGVYVFQFQQLFDDIGALSLNCVEEFDGKHFVIGQNDIYVHNGVQKHSVITGKVKDRVFSSIKSGDKRVTFLVADRLANEMWVCYQANPSSGGNCCADQAAVWNWVEDTWTFREIPPSVSGTYGIYDPQDSDSWDLDANGWDSDSSFWGGATYDPSRQRLLFVSNSQDNTYVVTETHRPSDFKTYPVLERVGLYGGEDNTIKSVTSVSPQIAGTGLCNVYVGSSKTMDSPTLWHGPFEFKIGEDFKIDCRVFGRSLGFRFEFPTETSWEFHGYTVETTRNVGRR